ncbi:MAG: hypothetical protein HRK26_03130 [Rickettsiaceae bacterium H1]|nr:hypothetical protein [Rickettsiaceae bacterium H1]
MVNDQDKKAHDCENNKIKKLTKKTIYKQEIKRKLKITFPITAIPAIGAIIISVLSTTTNLMGNKPFTENKIAIITSSCLAVAAVIVAIIGVAIGAKKAKIQIYGIKNEPEQLSENSEQIQP